MPDGARWNDSGHDGDTSITVCHQNLIDTSEKQTPGRRL